MAIYDEDLCIMSIKHSQAFGDQNPEIDQGKNGSEALAIAGAQICIGIPRKNRGFSDDILLKFKGFITDFSRTTESDYEEAAFSVSNSPRVIKGVVKNKISLSFDVPSQSINEARINLRKVQELCRFFLTSNAELQEYTHNPDRYTIFVKYANLISALSPSTAKTDTYDQITKGGERCIFTEFSFEIDVESGFYEGIEEADTRDVGKFIPKKMSITLGLVPIIETKINDERIEGIWSRFPQVEEGGPAAFRGLAEEYPFGIDYKSTITTDGGEE